MAVDFYVKRGDTLPAIQATLLDANDDAVNITGSTVRFLMTNKATGVQVVDASAVITDGPNGVVQYNWVDGDTDTSGAYRAEWEVTFGVNQTETFPNSAYINIKITDDLGGVEPD